MDYNYAIKVLPEGNIAANRFPVDVELPTGYTLVTKKQYEEIVQDMIDEPDGSYDPSSKKWKAKSQADKDKDVQDELNKKEAEAVVLFEQEDAAWLERYNRFKSNGDI